MVQEQLEGRVQHVIGRPVQLIQEKNPGGKVRLEPVPVRRPNICGAALTLGANSDAQGVGLVAIGRFCGCGAHQTYQRLLGPPTVSANRLPRGIP